VPSVDSKLDPAAFRAALRPWLAVQLDAPDLTISTSDVPKQGMSNETVLFDASWTTAAGPDAASFVLRMTPADNQLFLGGDVRLQYEMTCAARRHGIPAANCRWFEPDDSVLGTPFYVMDRVVGRTPLDVPSYNAEGWVKDLTVAERGTLWANGMEQLARIHQLDHTHDDFALLRERAGGRQGLDIVLGHLDEWCRDSLDGRAHLTIDPAMAWLFEHRPAHEPPVGVSWGDARIGNMIFGDDLSVVAVTDWEMASIAPAEVDLAWWLLLDEFFSTTYRHKRLAGLPDAAATVEHHERQLGRPLHDLRWYDVLALTRYAAAMVRMGDLFARSGAQPDDIFVHVNPIVAMLAERLGLPEPSRPE